LIDEVNPRDEEFETQATRIPSALGRVRRQTLSTSDEMFFNN
jgi:hypothetical protein